MTAHDDLYAAIMANPFDDGPRLVYADRLDEQGESERAEFIRYQIAEGQSALIISHASPCCTIPFRNHQIGFNLGMDGLWEIERGFPSHVSLTMREFMGGRCDVMGCNGSGINSEMGSGRRCDNCNGTGRIEGLAKRIGQWPVTGVRISDSGNYMDHKSLSGDYWFVNMPEELQLTNTIHATRRDIEKSLSFAAVNYARSLNGYGALKQ